MIYVKQKLVHILLLVLLLTPAIMPVTGTATAQAFADSNQPHTAALHTNAAGIQPILLDCNGGGSQSGCGGG